MKSTVFIILLFLSYFSIAQSYQRYRVGKTQDVVTIPTGGVCLMGGSTENDAAMRWFLQRANGGDVVVLRASGGDGYNDYFLNQLGVSLNSVTTFVCLDAESGLASEIIAAVNNAEAIWFAGGDQWKYISFWRNSPLNAALNNAIKRNVPIGGTSAGMAILGGHYFTAERRSVNSVDALKNPLDVDITLDSSEFLQTPFLANVLTDTHFSERERKGRLTVFLANLMQSNGPNVKAIACDEKVAVCIDENGKASVYAVENESDKSAFFINKFSGKPEVFSPGQPLTWNNNQRAVSVFQVVGTPTGSTTFNLAERQLAENSGRNLFWYVENGKFFENDHAFALSLSDENSRQFYPNPIQNKRLFLTDNNVYQKLSVYNVTGVLVKKYNIESNAKLLDLTDLPNGNYVFVFQNKAIQKAFKMIVE